MLEIAVLKNFDSGTYRAGVQLAGSLTTYLDHIPVSVAIPSSAMEIGNRVILAIPGGNPKDACVIATWPQGSAGGGMEVHGNEYHDPDFAELPHTHSDLSPAHKDQTSGVHGVGSNYVCQAPAASHLVRGFTKGWALNKLLKGGGIGADPAELSGWQVVAEVVVPSDCEYIDFTGLDINTDRFYVLFCSFRNPQSTGTALVLYVNGDYTESHYYAQVIDASGTIITSARYNSAYLGGIPANDRLAVMAYLVRDPDGYPRHYTFTTRYTGSGVAIQNWAVCKTATVTNITSLRVLTGVTGAIGADSVALLCKPRTA